MTTIMQIAGCIAVIIGVVFSVLGVVGILRLPDTYSRLHASGKTGTLGMIFLCIGVGLLMPQAALKLVALALFMLFTAPVTSHAIAAAVHRHQKVKNATDDTPIATESSTTPHIGDMVEEA